jgi:hypothetical protein
MMSPERQRYGGLGGQAGPTVKKISHGLDSSPSLEVLIFATGRAWL